MFTTVKKLKEGMPWFGNRLHGQPAPPAPQSTSTKHTGDALFSKPPKRQRIEDDANRDASLVPSSAELPDQPHLPGSSCRKGLGRGSQNSQSVRSGGNRRSSGVGVDELRSVEQSMRPKNRSRHKAGLQKTTPASAYKPKSSLQQLRNGLCNDPIQDDEDVILLEESSGTNGRAVPRVSGKSPYTTATFAVPVSEKSSEDELIAPFVSHHQPAKKKPRIPEEQANTGRKRPAEVNEDERERTRVPKRRPEISSRADMQRTQFSTKPTDAQGGREALHITQAVCGPTYVYPANGTMHEDMIGASNVPCHLVPITTDGKLLFEAVDDAGEVIPELEWMTPSISRIQRITSNPDSAIVQISKSMDYAARLRAGSLLYVSFRTSQDVQEYIRLCCKANVKIQNDSGRLST